MAIGQNETAKIIRDLLRIAKVAMPSDLYDQDPRVLLATAALANLQVEISPAPSGPHTGPWYHVSPRPLTDGQVLEPGQWGRQLHQMMNTPGAGTFVLAWELALEAARQMVGQPVARHSCVYVWSTLHDAVRFRQTLRTGANIYEVSPVDPQVAVFRGDYLLISTGGRTVGQFGEAALRYWRGSDATEFPELLVDGSVAVKGLVAI